MEQNILHEGILTVKFRTRKYNSAYKCGTLSTLFIHASTVYLLICMYEALPLESVTLKTTLS